MKLGFILIFQRIASLVSLLITMSRLIVALRGHLINYIYIYK